MHGLMQDQPLLISSLITYADHFHGATEMVSRTIEGPIHRYTLCDAHRRAKRLANALTRLGVKEGDRIGTLAWNGFRHFEIYFAVSGMGAVCHTINPRLFPEQIVYIINHAEDRYVFFDLTFAPLVAKLRTQCPNVKGWVAMTDRAHMPKDLPDALCFEDLVAAESDDFTWPELDERAASSLCYTSGTTGNPKGVLYSHRSTVLHSFGAALPDAMKLSASDVVLPVVPMFHANAWGLAYACPLVGAKLVFPGPWLDGKSLHDLFEAEGVTVSAGVPTVWQGLLTHVESNGLHFRTMRRTIIGGSACPPAMMRAFQQRHDVQVLHAWGMTELSPVGTVCTLKPRHLGLPEDQQIEIQSKQGRSVFGVDMKIVGEDGAELPHDGKTPGELMVRGPWVISGYFKGEGNSPLVDGWFPTGDVSTIDEDGFMQITDRSKDVIKSGGEWIGSIDLENIAMSHPAVEMAACIAARHPKWDERPLLVVVKKANQTLTRDELIRFYDGRIAKWWTPDDVVFVDKIPLGATGKVQKNLLRDAYGDHLMATSGLRFA